MPVTATSDLKYFYIILFAILVHIALIYWPGDDSSQGYISEDASSAIRRAKSTTCKKELRDYASRIQDTQPLYNLERRCHLDRGTNSFRNIGYLALSRLTDHDYPVERLQESVEDLIDCLETCYIYGHSYGGYHESSNGHQCYCGDKESLNSIREVRGHGPDETLQWFRVNEGAFSANVSECKSDTGKATAPVRLAFILTLNGRSSLQVKRLLSNIYSPSHIYYLHVDNYDDYLHRQLLPLEEKYSNIIVAKARFATIWGGPQLLIFLIDAFEQLSKHTWSYAINLSESDFPIKPLKKLESHLRDKNCIFLRAHNLKGYSFIKKQGLDRSFYQCERRVWRIGRRKLPKGLVYSGGSDWFALPRIFIDYILKNKIDPLGLVHPLLQLYNHSLLPAESFFHTLALNSELCDKFVDNNLRINNWRRKQGCKCQRRSVVDWCGCSPHIYRASDISRLIKLDKSADLFFSRKFDPTVSLSILNEVERLLLQQERTHLSSDYWLNIYSQEIHEDRASLDGSVLRQLAVMASTQVGLDLADLRTVFQYFNQDTYVGMVLEICKEERCRELLLKRAPQSNHLHITEMACLAISPYQLLELRVGHGFDSNERIFRNHRPPSVQSDLTVYHVWLVNHLHPIELSISELKLQFQWTSPKKSIINQDIKIRPESKRARLSFAHRLDSKHPLDAGLWTLRILHQNISCIDYEFLVFDGILERAEQRDFDKLFKVTGHCSRFGAHDDTLCLERKWSISRERHLEANIF